LMVSSAAMAGQCPSMAAAIDAALANAQITASLKRLSLKRRPSFRTEDNLGPREARQESPGRSRGFLRIVTGCPETISLLWLVDHQRLACFSNLEDDKASALG
jgi:hypothetical protein